MDSGGSLKYSTLPYVSVHIFVQIHSQPLSLSFQQHPAYRTLVPYFCTNTKCLQMVEKRCFGSISSVPVPTVRTAVPILEKLGHDQIIFKTPVRLLNTSHTACPLHKPGCLNHHRELHKSPFLLHNIPCYTSCRLRTRHVLMVIEQQDHQVAHFAPQAWIEYGSKLEVSLNEP
ncbi:hypothetical protein IGI04_036908 [Brassica rapa subsp. trilocularis]|uniref:Uncharacterized protein n=1 Tax=Brassica rapa subsp. trilocularis TaxID=1813537 RepID=A0ABQ7LIS8_BRACM|nr:hypothetical protein IGI04_036908 [Brassica rapa subsp. trilocularis]